MRKDRKERRLYKVTPPAGGMVRSISNCTPLSRATGKLVFLCPVCGIAFAKPAAWAKRANNHHCSRACAAEARKVRVETHCVVCGKAMEKTPSVAARTTTCGKECSSIRRRSENPNPRSFVAYKAAVMKIAARCVCKKCGAQHGPWVVRGMKFKIGDDKSPNVATDEAELWCKHCHLKEVSPEGGAANARRLLTHNAELSGADKRPLE